MRPHELRSLGTVSAETKTTIKHRVLHTDHGSRTEWSTPSQMFCVLKNIHHFLT